MSKEQNIVIVAAYMATEPAKKNFDQLARNSSRTRGSRATA